MSGDVSFGATLKKLRNKKGMSQNEVCLKLGFSQQKLSSWETGKSMPASDALLKLLELYEVENILEEFGFESVDEKDFQPKQKEKRFILKYRDLPTDVKKAIETIVNSYSDLMKNSEETKKVSIFDYTHIKDEHLIAAHGSENADEEEMERIEADIEKIRKEHEKRDKN